MSWKSKLFVCLFVLKRDYLRALRKKLKIFRWNKNISDITCLILIIVFSANANYITFVIFGQYILQIIRTFCFLQKCAKLKYEIYITNFHFRLSAKEKCTIFLTECPWKTYISCAQKFVKTCFQENTHSGEKIDSIM